MTTKTIDLEALYQKNPIEYHNYILQETLNNIEVAEERQLMEADEATQARQQALGDFNLRVFQELGYDMNGQENTDDEEEQEYSNDMDLATFASGSAVGSAIVGLIEDEYESPEDGIAALVEATNYDEETILGILSGQFVPDESLINDIVQVFDMHNNEIIGLHYLASEARQDDMFGLGEYDSEDQEEDEDDESDKDVDEEEETEQYSRISQLEDQLASFQAQKDLKNEIDRILYQAEELVESGHLMPVEYNALFGELPDCLDDEKVALFSSSCESNQIELETQLYSLQHYLKVAEKRGPLNMFGRIADNSASFSSSQSQQDKEIEKTARHTAHHYMSNGLIKFN